MIRKHLFLAQIVFVALLFAVPFSAMAQIPGVNAPIVPCGGDSNPCQFCHLYVLAKNIVDFLLVIIIPLVGIALAVGGISYMASGGNPGKAQKGKDIISTAVFGLLIALAAWIIINTIIATLATGSALQWNQFPNCSI